LSRNASHHHRAVQQLSNFSDRSTSWFFVHLIQATKQWDKFILGEQQEKALLTINIILIACMYSPLLQETE
jgi:hypothetical protein